MNFQQFRAVAERYSRLRVAVLGDFCLDRYLEIDPEHRETSIETGLPVHNVVQVRAQPGGAGTVLNNLSALGVGCILPIGFAGDDGEGYELQRALTATPGVRMDFFTKTEHRRTFTYCKPLVMEHGKPPRELNRLDSKNWSATPTELQNAICAKVRHAGDEADAIIVLDQVDLAGTGVVTDSVLKVLSEFAATRPEFPILADSRRGLAGYPPLIFKMNNRELAVLTGGAEPLSGEEAAAAAANLARRNQRQVFITMAGEGLLGAMPSGQVEHVPALPLRGEIDVVGAGDSVSANLAAALCAGAALRDALEIASAAASVVIHKLGTTGTASPSEIAGLLSS